MVSLPEQIDPAAHNVRGIDRERVNIFYSDSHHRRYIATDSRVSGRY